MEKRIEQKISTYINDFKNSIKTKLENDDKIDYEIKSDLLKYIFDYNNLSLEKEDFTKRKRVKSNVPHYMRCMAKRASGEQCTRKKKMVMIIVVHMIKIDHMVKLVNMMNKNQY